MIAPYTAHFLESLLPAQTLHQDRILCLRLIAGHFVTITKHPNPFQRLRGQIDFSKQSMTCPSDLDRRFIGCRQTRKKKKIKLFFIKILFQNISRFIKFYSFQFKPRHHFWHKNTFSIF